MRTPRLPIPYYCVHRDGPLRWWWEITDGKYGPTLVGPHRALTRRGARRRIDRAARAMHAAANARAVAHELTAAEAHAVCAVLHAVEHIDVSVAVVDHVAHIRPSKAMSTAEEVTALRAVAALTDAVVWGGVR